MNIVGAAMAAMKLCRQGNHSYGCHMSITGIYNDGMSFSLRINRQPS